MPLSGVYGFNDSHCAAARVPSYLRYSRYTDPWVSPWVGRPRC